MASYAIKLGHVAGFIKRMSDATGSRFSRLADNTALTVLARLIIPPIATAAIAVGSYYLSQTSAKLDRIEIAVQKGAVQDELFAQFLKLRGEQRDEQIKGINQQLGDHEGRIRTLERAPR